MTEWRNIRLSVISDYLDGLPTKEIAAKHRLHYATVMRYVNVPRRREANVTNQIQREARNRAAVAPIVEDYLEGVPIADIIAGRKVSARTVRRVVQKIDLPRRHPAAWGRLVRTG